ncbi:Mitochondrial distribution and morphology protein 12 [Orbilia oligospora]|nr:Mitochondrial distribution and morphology protein 12 [Orbilia oligospora]KAF3178594.1 Mitochondrial distribution and morphology protein 12 [Orbilia oligospora]KAF3243034.1 Mitochondrial distribution and morphology protein 12 [Orbilia oligospora]KAF3260206.1 Mitochondrial distribution and morphology protein 12 [Orbilia oligospora]KAF3292061.1 Mitochondrial distribution and morphology protein 12 [Orbilia oligospora]
MAVDINWPALTTGPDGKEYADALCGFFHDKFQQIPFPKFLRSVSVVSFDLGTVPPEIEIQDITDPYPEFYEDAYAEGDDEDEEFDNEIYNSPEEILKRARERRRRDRREGLSDFEGSYHADTTTSAPVTSLHTPILAPMGLQPPPYIDHRYPGLRPSFTPAVDQFSSSTFRGPTSNLHYFHSALTSGFSGGLTPLASLQQASVETFPGRSPLYSRSRRQNQQPHSGLSSTSPSQSPPSTADSSKIPPPISTSHNNPRLNLSSDDTHHTDGTREPPPTPFSDISISSGPQQQQQQQQSGGTLHSPLDSPTTPPDPHAPRLRLREPRDSDIQIIARVRYTGDIRMELTAELLIDYPAPSFVSLPVRLTITGMTFDGTAVIAHIGKRAHFCFVDNDHDHHGHRLGGGGDGIASMLKEIRIDSEIGEKGKGKQVLKNVGKVKDFVLDRVRRILEDEFVFPSSWTFLL